MQPHERRQFTHSNRPKRYPALERLISHAVVNEGFAHNLVTAPETAVAQHWADLSNEEREMVISITAATLPEFAARLHEKVQQAQAYAASRSTTRTFQ